RVSTGIDRLLDVPRPASLTTNTSIGDTVSAASSMTVSPSDAATSLFLAVLSICSRRSLGQRSQNSESTSPLIIKHSTDEWERTVAVLRGAKDRLTTSPKY